MLIVAVVSVFTAVTLLLAHMSWRADCKSLQVQTPRRALGWRIARNWVLAHGYECWDADIVKGVWHVQTAMGWKPVQEVLSWPQRAPVPLVQESVSEAVTLERVQ